MVDKVHFLDCASMFFMLRFGMNLNIRKVLLSKMRMVMMNLCRAFVTHEV